MQDDINITARTDIELLCEGLLKGSAIAASVLH
jgi:hypothetical protein